MDHCGNPDVRQAPSEKWIKGIENLAKKPNVSAKISGIIARVDQQKPLVPQLAPFVNRVWNAFGPDRVVFGGDWPVCLNGGTYAQWVNALREIAAGRTRADQAKLFHDNALRVYRLEKV
jgi:predicted TIM-barrel fold metal-dependent hydrolase